MARQIIKGFIERSDNRFMVAVYMPYLHRLITSRIVAPGSGGPPGASPGIVALNGEKLLDFLSVLLYNRSVWRIIDKVGDAMYLLEVEPEASDDEIRARVLEAQNAISVNDDLTSN